MNIIQNYITYASVLFLCVALLYPTNVSAVVQSNFPAEQSTVISIDTDTVLTADGEYVWISLMDESYLLLNPNASIRFRTNESNNIIQLEILRGALLIHMMNRAQFSLNLIVNESMIMVKSANAGVDKRGFYWVEAGEIEIMSLATGSQVTIRKGMYAQSNNSTGEIVSGNLSINEIRRISSSYRPGEDTDVNKSYRLGYSEYGELVLREISGVLPAGNDE